MKKSDEPREILIVDDEPEYLTWVEEFLVSLGYAVVYARTVTQALSLLRQRKFRLFLVDMNVPSDEALDLAMRDRSPLARKFPGLAFAIEARSQGYNGKRVVAYTVHDDDAIHAELQKLSCWYVLKGRPESLKTVVKSALSVAT